jgi:phospholipase C
MTRFRGRRRLVWKNTAIFVTFDEGGGYYDSGYGSDPYVPTNKPAIGDMFDSFEFHHASASGVPRTAASRGRRTSARVARVAVSLR